MQLYILILNEMVMEIYCMHACKSSFFELFMYKCVTDDKSPIRQNNLLRELQYSWHHILACEINFQNLFKSEYQK